MSSLKEYGGGGNGDANDGGSGGSLKLVLKL